MISIRWLGCALLLAAGLTSGYGRARAEEDAKAADPAVVTASRSEIRDRAESMPLDRRVDVDKRIRATVDRVNREVTESGQAKVAARLAAEFKVTLDGLLDEKSEHGLSWGEMVIAHTLMANAGEKVELRDLAALREEGLTWGAIAFGLRYHLEDLEDLIKSEGRVAMGLSKK